MPDNAQPMSARGGPLVPLIVACPAFLQNIAITSISVALPSIAVAFGVTALQLDIVVTSYILSIALFLPASAWLADRFGARRTFVTAIILFCSSSALCGIADTIGALVACRIGQGMSAALMIPVGRLILLRTTPQSQMVSAMVWYTIPPVVGRLTGPLIGGAIVTVMSWKGIFYINIPFGIIAIILALVYLKPDKGRRDLPRFDILGFVLLAGSLTALLWVAELLGKGTGKMTELWPIAVGGLLAFAAYCLHNRRRAHAVIDLSILQFRLFRTNILGAAPLRIAIAANPFLLPLLFQLGFGLSPLTSGLLAAASAVGSLCTRAVVKPALTYLNLKLMLVVSTVLTAFCYASYAFFTETTPHWLIFLTLFIAGLFASLCMVSLNTLGFGSIPDDRKSHAVSLLAMAQQLFAGFGVVTASWLLSLAVRARGGDTTQIFKQDFSAAFVVIGGIAMVSAFVFMRIDSREEEGQTI